MAPVVGYSALVKVSTTTGGTYTAIGYLQDGSYSPERESIDITSCSATYNSQRFLMGLFKGGGSIKCVYDSSDADGQNLLRTNWLSGTALYFQFLANPSAAAGSQGYKVKAFVNKMDISIDPNGSPMVTFSILPTGAPVVDNGNADAS